MKVAFNFNGSIPKQLAKKTNEISKEQSTNVNSKQINNSSLDSLASMNKASINFQGSCRQEEKEARKLILEFKLETEKVKQSVKKISKQIQRMNSKASYFDLRNFDGTVDRIELENGKLYRIEKGRKELSDGTVKIEECVEVVNGEIQYIQKGLSYKYGGDQTIEKAIYFSDGMPYFITKGELEHDNMTGHIDKKISILPTFALYGIQTDCKTNYGSIVSCRESYDFI